MRCSRLRRNTRGPHGPFTRSPGPKRAPPEVAHTYLGSRSSGYETFLIASAAGGPLGMIGDRNHAIRVMNVSPARAHHEPAGAVATMGARRCPGFGLSGRARRGDQVPRGGGGFDGRNP